jgi:RNA polymerase sigma factor (sigma-70 family)
MITQGEAYNAIRDGAIRGARSVLRGKDHRGISESDIAQQVLMEYWLRPRPIRSPVAFGYTCGRNRALDALRKNANAKEYSISTSPIVDSLSTKQCSPERKLFTDELIEAIRKTVCEQDWFILNSRNEEVTFGEIGNKLGMPSSTVRVRYNNIRNRLNEKFGDDYQR